ncbi:MAG: alpha-mannosidase [bacterium]|nr:alpha-mannosidase [bacterium]
MKMLKERIGRLIREIGELIYTVRIPVSSYQMLYSDEKFGEIDTINTDAWRTLEQSESWGGHRVYAWFDTTVMIPEELDRKCVVYELKTGREGEWDATNPQFSIFVNGQRRQGLDVNHREILLTEQAKAGDTYRITLSAFTGDHNDRLLMDSELKVLDRATEHYYYDLSVPYQTARLLQKSDRAYITIITKLNESLNLLDLRKPYSDRYYESLRQAQAYLTEEFYEKYCGGDTESIYCVGHTHIDLAWMWTLAVTQDKAVRSFSTVLELMRRYPEYIFMSSQPQLYQYVKENAPEVYQEIKKRVAEGRWETEGGMYVEADCNLSSGESLIRQFLYGKRFFKEEFGTDNEILWLPDVFGYSAALPQIMKECGIHYFMTTKISWNEFNKMPYDTFEWEGIDGTRILTHFSPSRDYHKAAVEDGTETEHFTTYNAYINPSQVKGAWERYSQKELNRDALMTFGYGDGGGGPTKDMLENQRRLALGIPGCPKTVMSTARRFFHRLEEDVKESRYLPVWTGELYLEYHRGTYTSMARNKRYNRKAEFLYGNAELFSFMASVLTDGAYPQKGLQEGWKIILRNQFHDILPGSSIKEVYEDSRQEYEQASRIGHAVLETALERLVKEIAAKSDSLIVFNPTGRQENQIVSFSCPEHIDAPMIMDCNGILPVQRTGEQTYIFCAHGVPSKGYKTYQIANQSDIVPTQQIADESNLIAAHGGLFEGCQTHQIVGQTVADEPVVWQEDKRILSNEYVQITFAQNGQFQEIYDKLNKRQVLKEHQNGNVLMTYEDKPHNFDAWDINNYYTEKSWEADQLDSLEAVEEGPIRTTIRLSRSYLDSHITQFITLCGNSPEIIIRNEIDWKEKQILLKTLFPVDIHTDEATYEIQYGNVKRKTHYNTSWDYARFEVCMHKWLDVSEDNYGVSIMNDCKYGCHVHDGVIGISMLKSAIDPNPEADKEHHSFVLSIYPHKGDWKNADTIDRAYLLNNPLFCLPKTGTGTTLPAEYSMVQVDAKNVVIEVVKKAEDGNGLILRLYEAYNRRTQVNMKLGISFTIAEECNMLEESKGEVAHDGDTLHFEMKPYEIKTLRIQ